MREEEDTTNLNMKIINPFKETIEKLCTEAKNHSLGKIAEEMLKQLNPQNTELICTRINDFSNKEHPLKGLRENSHVIGLCAPGGQLK